MNPQPDDICQRPDCKSVRIAARHAPCPTNEQVASGYGCICGGKRDHLFCHDFREATK